MTAFRYSSTEPLPRNSNDSLPEFSQFESSVFVEPPISIGQELGHILNLGTVEISHVISTKDVTHLIVKSSLRSRSSADKKRVERAVDRLGNYLSCLNDDPIELDKLITEYKAEPL